MQTEEDRPHDSLEDKLALDVEEHRPDSDGEEKEKLEPIYALEQQLLELFNDTSMEADVRSAQIQEQMSAYIAHQKDWQKYCFFTDVHYTRNLVSTNDKFELIILCWKAGQASRIHNHSGSNCWMGVVQGPMIESLYSKVADGRVLCEREHPSQPGVCPELRLERTTTLYQGDVGYIHDGIGLHRVQSGLADGVTLHLYYPPISIATLFEPDNNTVIQRTPGFYSIRGKRQC